MGERPNFLVILIDDLRFDEFGAGGHPYMKTPNVDRIAREGANCVRAFHPTPICSPNRASILTGQYASRHGIIDNVARDALSHRLPNYHLALQGLGYETAHVGKWHMGNDGTPRPGYDTWVSFDGHGRLVDPKLNENGVYREHKGYLTDLLNERALAFVDAKHDRPWSLFLAHKAVHPDAFQAADGTLDLTQWGGYKPAPRHADLYRGAEFPRRPNMLPPEAVVKSKPAWAEAFGLKRSEKSQAVLESLHAGSQEEIRLRAAMMASVDEGVGTLLDALAASGQLDRTFVLFLGDNGYFFSELVLTLDIAPTLVELAGGKPGPQIQGRSLAPLLAGRKEGWRRSFLAEYFTENALPWLVGMSYKAIRTDRHKLIHWVNREGVDELYDLDADPYELANLIDDPRYAAVKAELRAELARLVAEAVGL